MNNDCIISDFIVQIKPKLTIKGLPNNQFKPFTCLVDVKSTKNNYFSIGGAFLKKYRNFANAMNLPLVFAVRFLRARQHALWAIIEDKPSKNSLKITVQDGIEGIKNIFWDEYIITPNPNLCVICEFSKNANKIGSIRHNEYGFQISATFTDGKNTLKQVDPSAFMTCMMLEPFNLEEFKIEKIDDDTTLQYLNPKYFTVFYLT